MKRVLIALVVLFVIACRKTPESVTPATPVIQQETAFTGYKVASNAKQLGTDYWENTPVLSDLMIGVFQKNFEVFVNLPQGDAYCA